MGIVFVDVEVIGPTGISQKVKTLVDSGSQYSLLPKEIWTELGLKEKNIMEFVLADGTNVTYPISECRFIYGGIDRHSPVVLGDEGVTPLLGVVTLENMGLVLNPFTRELQPMRMMLT